MGKVTILTKEQREKEEKEGRCMGCSDGHGREWLVCPICKIRHSRITDNSHVYYHGELVKCVIKNILIDRSVKIDIDDGFSPGEAS